MSDELRKEPLWRLTRRLRARKRQSRATLRVAALSRSRRSTTSKRLPSVAREYLRVYLARSAIASRDTCKRSERDVRPTRFRDGEPLMAFHHGLRSTPTLLKTPPRSYVKREF